ncbi:MAG: hybrid sensor histidine kinase/response regulator [Rhodospirillales bacterium]|nr:MAG: hybrid sensor histidine kinase/response regulator [Rhodospirillales bacterium]
MDLHERLLAAFRIECREHLEHIRRHFVACEAEAPLRADLDEVFRHAHSLKGAARATDLRPIESLAHRLESLLMQIRSETLPFSSDARILARTLTDLVEDWMAAYDGGKELPDPADALAEADRFLGSQAPSQPRPQPESAKTTAVLAQRPPAKSTGRQSGGDEPIKVRAQALDRLLRSAGSLASEGASQSVVARRLRRFEDMLGELDRAWRHLHAVSPDLRRRRDLSTRDRAIERQAERIDRNLRWFAAEISAVRNLQHKSAWAVERMADELRRDIRDVRLAPAESVFAGFRKMVRDLAHDLGKDVDFKLAGLDVEADRQVLEALRDPVMHLLRNALAHGIEPSDVRVKDKKTAGGNIALSFSVEGQYLAVTIDDDGRGLNLERISKQAVERGLMSPEEVADASDAELARVIFAPGFSTAEKVDDLAGRGMGMSVVYEVVARLNGHVQWQPKQGPGTVFRLMVPLSISSQRLLLVNCQDQVFALPAEAISRVCRVASGSLKQVEGRSLMMLEDSQVPVRSLAELIKLDATGIGLKDGNFLAVIVKSPRGPVALAVDGVLEVAEAVIKDLGFPLPHGSVVSGAILHGEGRVVVVLNAYELIAAVEATDVVPVLSKAEEAVETAVPEILVVDDSMTTRTLEKSILEAHGYKVRVAVDGLDALIQLRANPVSLVVADVEMPRIDGFALLKELKHDKSLAHIPVILVTSLKRNEDIDRGFELGAAAYLVKQRFDQNELLETIRQIL